MFEVSQIIQGEFEAKGSKFLSFLTPFNDFEEHLYALKAEHPKAVHFVYASRVMELQIQESFSDDGEPKGSSGVPTLNVLRGENLINIGLITVRYFGGTLLGVGGLVRAYTQSAQQAILQAKQSGALQEYRPKIEWQYSVSYPMLERYLYCAKKYEIKVINREFNAEGVCLTLSAVAKNKEEFEVVWNA